MFRHKHKHPAFKALRDTVAFVVLCVALQGYVARTDGAEAAAAFRTVWAHSGRLLRRRRGLAGLLGRCRSPPSAACVRPLQCHGHGLAGKPAPRKRK